MDMAVASKIIGGLFVAWLTGYGTGIVFRSVWSFVEKAAR